MTTTDTPRTFTRATRKGHGFTNGQLIEWAGVQTSCAGHRIMRGRIYTMGHAMMLVKEGVSCNPDDFETYADYRDAVIAGDVVGIGGPATKFWARPVTA